MQRRIDVIERIITTTEKKISDLAARDAFSHEARQALLQKLEIPADSPAATVPADVQQRADEDDDDEGLVGSLEARLMSC